MEDQKKFEAADHAFSPSIRDIVAVAFRHRKLTYAFLGAAVLVAIVFALALPKYAGDVKFMVTRERVDPSISPTPEQNTFAMEAQATVTEENLNSEVEILNSHEMLRNVVLATNLGHRKSLMSYVTGWWGSWRSDDEKLEAVVQKLDKDLDIETVKRSNIIQVTYKNRDREVVGRVLKTLSALYLQKHMEVHRPSGQFAFFDGETERYHKGLMAAEESLSDFPKKYGVVSPAADRDLVLQKLNEFRASLQVAGADIQETQKRIEKLQQEDHSIPERVTTTSRKVDNPELFQKLKGTLLDLELKRVDLLTKFQPEYRPVQEIDKQIADAKTSIAKEESTPLRDDTTDVNPTHQWVWSEMAKADADRVGLRARETALRSVVAKYEAMVRDLDQKAILQSDLTREAKAQEQNYLLYLRKREEARITDTLDQSRIVNISMAEDPSVPALPKHMPMTFAFIGLTLTLVMGSAVIWTLEHFDSTLRTPTEVESFLNIPLLAAVPYRNGFHANGNG
ncbi:MAG TPA: hypothetical protein VH350_02235, partial [Candidatus Sulfotelmatobacter sp.]|nr:hypothetical protein [Candidatus Sulfotelmatobacter sp.]